MVLGRGGRDINLNRCSHVRRKTHPHRCRTPPLVSLGVQTESTTEREPGPRSLDANPNLRGRRPIRRSLLGSLKVSIRGANQKRRLGAREWERFSLRQSLHFSEALNQPQSPERRLRTVCISEVGVVAGARTRGNLSMFCSVVACSVFLS